MNMVHTHEHDNESNRHTILFLRSQLSYPHFSRAFTEPNIGTHKLFTLALRKMCPFCFDKTEERITKRKLTYKDCPEQSSTTIKYRNSPPEITKKTRHTSHPRLSLHAFTTLHGPTEILSIITKFEFEFVSIWKKFGYLKINTEKIRKYRSDKFKLLKNLNSIFYFLSSWTNYL